jgi:hypothetical protein
MKSSHMKVIATALAQLSKETELIADELGMHCVLKEVNDMIKKLQTKKTTKKSPKTAKKVTKKAAKKPTKKAPTKKAKPATKKIKAVKKNKK